MSGRRLRLALACAACAAAASIAPPPTKLNVRFATADDFKAIASLRTSIFSSHLTSLYSKIEQDRLFVDTMSKKSAVVAAVRPTDGAYLGCADVGREELPGRGVTACYVTSVCVHPDARRTGHTRLYFGCRRRDVDFLYREELLAAEASGALTTLRTAFSREAGKPKQYVQHLLRDDAADAFELVRGRIHPSGLGERTGRALTFDLVRVAHACPLAVRRCRREATCTFAAARPWDAMWSRC